MKLLCTVVGAVVCAAQRTSGEDSQRPDSYRIIPLRRSTAEAVDLAVKSLRSGKIIAVPTDTVYGVAVDAANPEALEDLYALIRRPYWKPVVLCVRDRRNITQWGVDFYVQEPVISLLLPNRVTVLLRRTASVYHHVNPGIGEIGFRVFGDRTFVTRVVRKLGRPIVLSSATVWNRSHALDIEDFRDLWPGIDLIFDGGRLDSRYRAGSTVLSLAVQKRYSFFRRGCCNSEVKAIMLQQVFMNELPYFPEDQSGEEMINSWSVYPVVGQYLRS